MVSTQWPHALLTMQFNELYQARSEQQTAHPDSFTTLELLTMRLSGAWFSSSCALSNKGRQHLGLSDTLLESHFPPPHWHLWSPLYYANVCTQSESHITCSEAGQSVTRGGHFCSPRLFWDWEMFKQAATYNTTRHWGVYRTCDLLRHQMHWWCDPYKDHHHTG